MALGTSDLLLVLIGSLLTLLGVLLQSLIAQNQFQKQLGIPAMKKLFLLVTNRKAEPEEWAEKIIGFLNTFEAAFVPIKIQKKTLKLVYEMDDKYAEAYPGKREKFTDADAQKVVEDFEKEYESMTKDQKADVDFGGWLLQNKVELGKVILKEIRGEKPLD